MTSKDAAPEVVTLGCRLNAFESEVMRDHAKAAGLNDTVIFNTCAVTTEAERDARRQIRKLRRERPDARIIVSGCAAQIAPEKFDEMPEVDLVLGNEEKLQLESYLPSPEKQKIQVSDIMQAKEIAGHLISGFESHSRAFVQVQQGCDHRCTFCIIPYGRGNSRSVPIGHIVDQVNQLTGQGYHEAVLTGVDISSYGSDLPGQPSLGQMVRRLLALAPDLKRLRLSSLDPAVIDDELMDLIATEPRLMPHLHLSVQAGSDLILKRMKRRHNRKDVIELTTRIRELRPDVVFGADLITGFPTESDDMFEDTLRLVDDAGLTYLHVFPYSPRPDTPAANMPQIDEKIRKARAAALRQKGEQAKLAYFDLLNGQTAEVLVERDGRGYTETYAPVRLNDNFEQGSIVSALITSASPDGLTAQISAD
ncbi:MAG: tRNA (N(6)-L-threonylcarbamoyladenosine(37)-C(2))-methylthiotransferase MtaB [Rhodospirillaceae bacterium]|nr:tRNA (N(6)-L-threonylcarbamoyladenosine(37)-C(2))-methylthiotransferase MtaB [Rhodospirillaceae bacterium]MBT5940166.1 tRNA (N(6)-L-threonylcarbamoyladenosine(37)-C(2))-methylthiotransferase MtaB [Rhodospirillaceae bacterium]MBT7266548.1 tRNA (N(6)-L-threonylcarbamoyladenosine(37)-C(2))-methylthiotransferase MtaB [Rhodospirillaceae bacterium]